MSGKIEGQTSKGTPPLEGPPPSEGLAEKGTGGKGIGDTLRILHPSFWHYLGMVAIPWLFLCLIPLGVDAFYVLLSVWALEILVVLGCWVAIATTSYVIKKDCLEVKVGILVKQSMTIPYDQIVDITFDQTLLQRLFDIGNIFVETAAGKKLESALFGVEKPREVVDTLFALKSPPDRRALYIEGGA